MLKDFLLSPGRYLCRKFTSGKKKVRFASKQAIRGPVVPVSIVCWLAVAALAVWAVFRFASPPIPNYNNPATQTETTASNEAGAAAGPTAVATSATPGEAAPGGTSTTNPVQTTEPIVEQSLTPNEVVGGEVWLVIVESIPKNKRTEAEQSQARHKRRGLTLELFDTDAYPLLKGGMWTLASGPYESRKEAEAAAVAIKPKVRDLMIRRGL
jgi:cytoskeletal protein RodZ